jgi:acetate kinase
LLLAWPVNRTTIVVLGGPTEKSNRVSGMAGGTPERLIGVINAGGLDAIVFTAEVGENAAPIRAQICRACSWLGVNLDDAANDRNETRISRPGARVGAFVIKTDENLMIARHTRDVAPS